MLMAAARKKPAGDTIARSPRVHATLCSKCKTTMTLVAEAKDFALLRCGFCEREIGMDLDPETAATHVRFRGKPWLWPPEAFQK